MIKLLLSILVGAGFFYLSMRGVDLHQIDRVWAGIRYEFLGPVFVVLLILPALRAYRLQFLYSGLEKVPFISIFKINAVGFLFIFLLPMRLGEFVIPYLMKKNSTISLSAAMGSIVVERLTDLIVLVSMLAGVAFTLNLPAWVLSSVIIMSAGIGFLVVALALVYFRTETAFRIVERLFLFLPARFLERIENMLLEFKRGLISLKSFDRWLWMVLQSVAIWMISALGTYLIILFVGLDLDFTAAIFTMSVNTIGVALPAGPGMIGNFQYSCVLALSAYSVDKLYSFAFANISYVLGVGSTFLVGLVFLPSTNLSFGEIKIDILRAFRK